MFISPRLMAALKIEGVGQVEVGADGSWRVEDVSGATLEEGADLHCPSATDWREPMCALLSFLGAAGEAYSYAMRNPGSDPENLRLFSEQLAEWAYHNGEELFRAEFELSDPPVVDI
jgi:hypothetical protein